MKLPTIPTPASDTAEDLTEAAKLSRQIVESLSKRDMRLYTRWNKHRAKLDAAYGKLRDRIKAQQGNATRAAESYEQHTAELHSPFKRGETVIGVASPLYTDPNDVPYGFDIGRVYVVAGYATREELGWRWRSHNWSKEGSPYFIKLRALTTKGTYTTYGNETYALCSFLQPVGMENVTVRAYRRRETARKLKGNTP